MSAQLTTIGIGNAPQHSPKYDFKSLEIGEWVGYACYCERDAKNLRTAATMYGRRYGVWLKVSVDPNYKKRLIVRRVDGPVRVRCSDPKALPTVTNTALEATSSDLLEAVKALRILVVELTERVEDLEEELQPVPREVSVNAHAEAERHNGNGVTH